MEKNRNLLREEAVGHIRAMHTKYAHLTSISNRAYSWLPRDDACRDGFTHQNLGGIYILKKHKSAGWRYNSILIITIFFFFFFTLQHCIVFAIHWLDSAMGVHVFLILNPPPMLGAGALGWPRGMGWFYFFKSFLFPIYSLIFGCTWSSFLYARFLQLLWWWGWVAAL